MCADPFTSPLGKTILPNRLQRKVASIAAASPYITAANDNFLVKDRLSARCGDLLRRLIGLHEC